MPVISVNTGWKIYDNWTELLDGTHYLLGNMLNDNGENVLKSIIGKSIIVNSHQMVEVIFFNSIRKYIDENRGDLCPKMVGNIESGLDDNIGFKKAFDEWPKLLTGKSFDRSCEPFSSQEKLRKIRNQLIHWPSVISVSNISSSAFYTAVRVSECIYSHFHDWTASEYSKFVEAISLSDDNVYLVKCIQQQ